MLWTSTAWGPPPRAGVLCHALLPRSFQKTLRQGLAQAGLDLAILPQPPQSLGLQATVPGHSVGFKGHPCWPHLWTLASRLRRAGQPRRCARGRRGVNASGGPAHWFQVHPGPPCPRNQCPVPVCTPGRGHRSDPSGSDRQEGFGLARASPISGLLWLAGHVPSPGPSPGDNPEGKTTGDRKPHRIFVS